MRVWYGMVWYGSSDSVVEIGGTPPMVALVLKFLVEPTRRKPHKRSVYDRGVLLATHRVGECCKNQVL